MQDLFDKCINPLGWEDKRLKECVIKNGTELEQTISILEPVNAELSKMNEYEAVHGSYDMIHHKVNLFFSQYRFGLLFVDDMPCFSIEIVFMRDGTASYTIQYDDKHIRDKDNPLFVGFCEKAIVFYVDDKTLYLGPFDVARDHELSAHRIDQSDTTRIQEVFDLYML